MNLQLATSNPAPPHAAAAKAAASVTGSNTPATTSDASDAIDFASLLAQSLPTGVTLPTQESMAATAAVKDEKTLAADPSAANLANPAIVGDPLAARAAAHAALPPNETISAATPKTGFGMAEQLHATLSATNSMALGLPNARPAAEHPESLSATSRANTPQLSSETLPAAAQFSAALTAATASTDSHVAMNAIDSTPLLPDRAVAIPVAPAPSSLAAPMPLRLEISTPLTAPGWDQQLGQHVVWMSSQHNQTAELRINPPDLGPVEMRLTMDQGGQQATLHFSSPHAEVRDTIESALPRLREMMADAGISLGHATVGGESLPQHATPDQHRSAPQVHSVTPLQQTSPDESARVSARRGNGLVDTFA